MKVSKNAIGVINNKFQGKYLKVLCVCSGDCLRSPTAAHLLAAGPYFYNTRSCGTGTDFAIVPISANLVFWADIIICMDENHLSQINQIQQDLSFDFERDGYEFKRVYNLQIEDDYDYRDTVLVEILHEKFREIFN